LSINWCSFFGYLFSIVPLLGSEVDAATGDLGADSAWNATVNTNIATGADLWGSVGSMISLAAVIVIVGIVLTSIMVFKKE
jgi:hypothetical protein